MTIKQLIVETNKLSQQTKINFNNLGLLSINERIKNCKHLKRYGEHNWKVIETICPGVDETIDINYCEDCGVDDETLQNQRILEDANSLPSVFPETYAEQAI